MTYLKGENVGYRHLKACWSCGAQDEECYSDCSCAKCEDPEGYEDWKNNNPGEYEDWLDSQEE